MERDNRDRIARATRFFARPESFTLECPHCGIVYKVKSGTKASYWDPRTSRLICRGKGACGRSFIVGLLAWPVKGPGAAASIPRDQVPNPRQLAQLRAEGGGFWLPDDAALRFARVDDTNITLEEDRPDRDPEEDEE